ncbi:hypothetical protein [Streptomyces sp. NPDC006267]
MTPTATAQPRMNTEEFGELARRAPELVRKLRDFGLETLTAG